MHHLEHWINGTHRAGLARIQCYSPIDNSLLGSLPVGDKVAVDLAVSAAKTALWEWRQISVSERCKYIERMADWLAAEYGEANEATLLKSQIMLEVGKPLPEADVEVIETSDFLRFFAEQGEAALSEQVPPLNKDLWPTKRVIVSREPVGVVAIIKPWNYPLEMIAWTLAPALIAGNTVVVKPSEYSSITASWLAKMCTAVDLPKGVVNIVYGDAVTGRALVNDKRVSMVSFTGSYGVGRTIAAACADRLARVSLELSGNDAAIVLDDADLELTSSGLVWGAFCNAGQVCVGTKRAYVHKKIYNKLLKMVVEKTNRLRMGVDVGPIVSQSQRELVASFLHDAVSRGAKVVSSLEAKQEGNYFAPVVLTELAPGSHLLQQECFGPILPIVEYENINEAIGMVNNSDFGLGASIWTSSSAEGRRVADQLDCGMVWVNDVNIAFPQIPWGGRKSSGVGFELSIDAFNEFTNPKSICFEDGEEKSRPWWYPYAN